MKMKLLFWLTVFISLSAVGPAHAEILTVAIDTNFPPFEFKDEHGRYTGFDIELWDAIAKKINKAYEFSPLDFKDILPGVQNGQFDVAIAGITIKPERKKSIDFSDAYYNSGLLILVREDENTINNLEDLNGKIVATKFATSSADFLSRTVRTRDIKLFPNTDAMFLELISGGADAVIFDSPVIAEFMRQADGDLVKIVGPLYMGQSYGIAFPKESPLVKEVNTALKELRTDGSYEDLYRKWFRTDPR